MGGESRGVGDSGGGGRGGTAFCTHLFQTEFLIF